MTIARPSLANRYLAQPDLTRSRFTPDGFRTGDLGFISDGELVVAGRTDDLMCVAGRNVYARDLESALSGVAGIRRGSVAVVQASMSGGARGLVALVEPNGTCGAELRRVAVQLNGALREAAGVSLRECVFLPCGTLPKTPSGKIKRQWCRRIAEAEPANAAFSGDAGCERVRFGIRRGR